jgi:hypothetical protein
MTHEFSFQAKMVFVTRNVCSLTTNRLERFSKVALTGELAFHFQMIFMSYNMGPFSSDWLEIFSRVGGALKFSL